MNSLINLTAVLAAVALSSSSIVKSPTSSGNNFELLILHNNDMHARFEQTSQVSNVCTTADREAGKCYGGFPRVAHVVKEARNAAATGQGPPVLYLNAGDTYTGTAWFTIYKWKVAAEFINALQPDAVSLGNHEFDNGVSGLTPFIEELTCPVLAANLILNNEPTLQAERNLMKSIVLLVNTTKVGVIGYLTPETKTLATRNNVEYIDEVIAIREEVAKLKKDGLKIFIALGHSGYEKDMQIAKEVEDIDLVIGGHTNTFLWNGTAPDAEKKYGDYPKIIKQDSGRLVPVVQAYAYTKYLGKLHLVFDSEGEIISFDGNPILLDNSITQDADVLSIVYRYRDNITVLTDEIIGNSSVELRGNSCRLEECNMGNLIADAMIYKYAAEYKGDGWTDAPLAFLNGGGVRASIAHDNYPVNITKGDLLTVMPFDEFVAKVTMNGTILLKMLEHGAYKIGGPQYPQMSGIKVKYDYGKPPGMRVLKTLVRCGKCKIPKYLPLNKTAEYNVLTSTFLSKGGDGYTMLSDLPIMTLSYTDLDCTTQYVRTHSPVYPMIEGRSVLINKDKLANASGVSTSISVSCLLLSISLTNLTYL